MGLGFVLGVLYIQLSACLSTFWKIECEGERLETGV